jgi:hypothetical protein
MHKSQLHVPPAVIQNPEPKNQSENSGRPSNDVPEPMGH